MNREASAGVMILRDILNRLDVAHVDAVAMRALVSRETFAVPSMVEGSPEFDVVMRRFADHVYQERWGVGMPEGLQGTGWSSDEYRFASWYGNKQTAGKAYRRGRAPRLDRSLPLLRHGVVDRLHEEHRRALPVMPSSPDVFVRAAPVRPPVFAQETSFTRLAPVPSTSWMSAGYMPPAISSVPSWLEPRTVLPVPSSGWARAELESMERNLSGPMPSLDALSAFAALRRSARADAGMLRALDEYATFLSERDVQRYHESVFLGHRLYEPDVALGVATALITEYGPVLFPNQATVEPGLVLGDIEGLLAGLAEHRTPPWPAGRSVY